MPLFNPRNEAERQREAITQERNRMIIERRAMPSLVKEFNRVGWSASRPDANIPMIISNHKKNIDNILRKIYTLSIEGSAKRTIQEAPKSFAHIEKKDLEGEIGRLISQWIYVNALAQSTLISGTTQTIITNILADHIGEGEAVISKLIRQSVGGSMGRARSMMIARTESHDASQGAQLDIVNSMNSPPPYKEWVSIKDSRTRHDHMKADAQTVGRKDYFDIGGSKMPRPGKGPAAQVISCRCVMVFVDKLD